MKATQALELHPGLTIIPGLTLTDGYTGRTSRTFVERGSGTRVSSLTNSTRSLWMPPFSSCDLAFDGTSCTNVGLLGNFCRRPTLWIQESFVYEVSGWALESTLDPLRPRKSGDNLAVLDGWAGASGIANWARENGHITFISGTQKVTVTCDKDEIKGFRIAMSDPSRPYYVKGICIEANRAKRGETP